MLTRMSEDDWAILLEVFDATQSKRGEPGHDDRKFLEALHFFTVHNLHLAGDPSRVRQVEQHLEAVLAAEPHGRVRGDVPAAGRAQRHRPPRPDARQHRGARARLGRRRKGGQQNQALGRSRGGFTCKIHLKTDLDGLPIGVHLTGGEASDCRQFETSLDIGPDITPRAALTDKGYDSRANRAAARKRGICPVIPHRRTAHDRQRFFPRRLYKARARIEQAVGKLKRFKRVALRCEKTAESFSSIVELACTIVLVKSVRRA